MADRFRAVWPVLDMTTPVEQWMDEALADLPNVLERAHCRRLDNRRPALAIAPGRSVPGSGGARLVVIAEVAAERVDHFTAAKRAWRQVVADAL